MKYVVNENELVCGCEEHGDLPVRADVMMYRHKIDVVRPGKKAGRAYGHTLITVCPVCKRSEILKFDLLLMREMNDRFAPKGVKNEDV